MHPNEKQTGSRQVEPRKKRKRKRTPSDQRRKTRRTEDQIEQKASDRQELWAEGEGNPNAVERLTVDLNGPDHKRRPEGLFAQVRQHRAEELSSEDRPRCL